MEPQALAKKVEEMQSWLETQPQLPDYIDECLLKRFIYSMHGDLQRTKRLIDRHYKLRAKHHRIFMERDPLDEESQIVLNAVDFLELPGKTEDNCKLLLYRFNDYMLPKLSFKQVIKVFFMMSDCQFAGNFDPEIEGEIIVFDMQGFALQHLTNMNIKAVKIFLKFLKEVHPVRLRAIHFLNAPTYFKKLMKCTVEEEFFVKMHFYSPKFEGIPEAIPRHMLPQEYGGQAGKLKELREHWLNELKDKRMYIIDDTIW